MLSKTILRILFLAVAMLAVVVVAGSASEKYDAFNHCGAPFCGSTGNVAAAGAVARMDRNNTADINDKLGEKLPKM